MVPDKNTSGEVKVVYANYDHKTHTSELRFGNAIITQNGAAMIRTDTFGVFKREAGEYVLADMFTREWKACIKKRAEEMAQEIIKGGKK